MLVLTRGLLKSCFQPAAGAKELPLSLFPDRRAMCWAEGLRKMSRCPQASLGTATSPSYRTMGLGFQKHSCLALARSEKGWPPTPNPTYQDVLVSFSEFSEGLSDLLPCFGLLEVTIHRAIFLLRNESPTGSQQRAHGTDCSRSRPSCCFVEVVRYPGVVKQARCNQVIVIWPRRAHPRPQLRNAHSGTRSLATHHFRKSRWCEGYLRQQWRSSLF